MGFGCRFFLLAAGKLCILCAKAYKSFTEVDDALVAVGLGCRGAGVGFGQL